MSNNVRALTGEEQQKAREIVARITETETQIEDLGTRVRHLRHSLYALQNICTHGKTEEFRVIDVAEMKTRRRCIYCQAIL